MSFNATKLSLSVTDDHPSIQVGLCVHTHYSRANASRVDSHAGVPRKHIEISVLVKDGDVGPNRDGGNEAVDQLSDRFPLSATVPVEGGSNFVGCGFGPSDSGAGQ